MSFRGDQDSLVLVLSRGEGGFIGEDSEGHSACPCGHVFADGGRSAHFDDPCRQAEIRPPGWVRKNCWLLCLGAVTGLLAVPLLLGRPLVSKR